MVIINVTLLMHSTIVGVSNRFRFKNQYKTRSMLFQMPSKQLPFVSFFVIHYFPFKFLTFSATTQIFHVIKLLFALFNYIFLVFFLIYTFFVLNIFLNWIFFCSWLLFFTNEWFNDQLRQRSSVFFTNFFNN